jgi:hypothetical protein
MKAGLSEVWCSDEAGLTVLRKIFPDKKLFNPLLHFVTYCAD